MCFGRISSFHRERVDGERETDMTPLAKRYADGGIDYELNHPGKEIE